MGTLNSFPFMQISKLDDIEELHVVAVNFTDASSGGANKVFADYDARVEVQTDRGENHVIKLDSHNPGSVAVLCKFTSSFMGAQLANDSSVMNFDSFKSTVPGASSLKLMSKVTLKDKGDAHTIQLKQKGADEGILINLNWNAGGGSAIDLDLGCFYELQGGTKKGCIDGLQFSRNRGGPRDQVTRQGCFTQKPWIWHEGDDRTGAESASGEFIHINPQGYGDIKRVDIYAFIYEGVARWDLTDAVMTLKVSGSPDIIVEMGKQTSSDMLCLIANLEFLGGDHTVIM